MVQSSSDRKSSLKMHHRNQEIDIHHQLAISAYSVQSHPTSCLFKSLPGKSGLARSMGK